MAFMLLSRRLACTFQNNYRLLAPSKPWGSWQELVLMENTVRTGDSWAERALGGKGTGQPVLLGLAFPHTH